MLQPGQIARFDYGILVANATAHPVHIFVMELDQYERDPNCSIAIIYNGFSGNAHLFGKEGAICNIETNPGHRYIIVERGGVNHCIGPQPSENYPHKITHANLTPSEMQRHKDLYEKLHQIEIPK